MELPSLSESQQKAAHTQKVASGRGYILFVAVVQLIVGCGIFAFATISTDSDSKATFSVLGAMVAGLGLIFLGLWFWAKYQPFPAALTALIIFVTVNLADAVLSPQGIASGIVIKLIILYGLIVAVKSGYALRKQQGS
jgi:hypothetical protein